MCSPNIQQGKLYRTVPNTQQTFAPGSIVLVHSVDHAGVRCIPVFATVVHPSVIEDMDGAYFCYRVELEELEETEND
jgi:hypothetical protein